MGIKKYQNFLRIQVESLDYGDNYCQTHIYCHTLIPMEDSFSQENICDSGVLSAEVKGYPILCFASKSIKIDNPFIKQLPMDCVLEISSECCCEEKRASSTYKGKLLITFMLDGIIKEIKCDEIQRRKGKLMLINTQMVDGSNKEVEYSSLSDFLNPNAYEFLGNQNKMNLELFNIVRIEPYPEPYDSHKDYDYGLGRYYTLPFDILSGDINVVNKTIHLFRPAGSFFSDISCSGHKEFRSIAEMKEHLTMWKKWSDDGRYVFKLSNVDININKRFADFTIYSDTITYEELEKIFGFEVLVNKQKRRDYDSYNELKKWCDDAYEGYSSEYLGLD